MEKEILQLGSSLAVIIPSSIAKQVHLKKGDHVRWSTSGRSLRLVPSNRLRPVNLGGLLQGKKVSWEDLRSARSQLQKQISKKWKNI
ncbi:MAG: AbrB/MazE/SpoVT family DNA-binding domain-containing protein [Deltaproteobacteria bacterium]|nr:AbrB/MazE/SpoVT family DNA-binding domain-containing protein [Deltaproteobacteria bacterium]